jgi:hypothetical protein
VRAVERERAPLSWYAALLAGVLPVLIVGFLASALANRVVFVGWGVVLALAWTLLLRFGMERGWGAWLLTARLLLVLGVGAAWLSRLVGRHHEELDLGFRAVFPGLYRPDLTDPRSTAGAAVVLGALGAAAIVAARLRPRLRRAA